MTKAPHRWSWGSSGISGAPKPNIINNKIQRQLQQQEKTQLYQRLGLSERIIFKLHYHTFIRAIWCCVWRSFWYDSILSHSYFDTESQRAILQLFSFLTSSSAVTMEGELPGGQDPYIRLPVTYLSGFWECSSVSSTCSGSAFHNLTDGTIKQVSLIVSLKMKAKKCRIKLTRIIHILIPYSMLAMADKFLADIISQNMHSNVLQQHKPRL